MALLVALVWASATATPARADGASPEGPLLYQGAYWGVQVHSGLVLRLDAGEDDGPGLAFGASARLASILSIADFQLTLLGSSYTAATPGRGGSGSVGPAGRVDVSRLSVGVEGHFHPLFMTVLKNDTFWYWLAGLYGSLGADLDVTGLEGDGVDRSEVDFGWHIGGGSDFPLTDPNKGWGIWVGVSYRLKFLRVDSGISGFRNFDEHTFMLTFAYRNNDIFFFRAPRPPEFDVRDPALREVD